LLATKPRPEAGTSSGSRRPAGRRAGRWVRPGPPTEVPLPA